MMASPIHPRPMIGMREFRERFAEITEPVRVVRSRGKIEVIGDWTPAKPVDQTHVFAHKERPSSS